MTDRKDKLLAAAKERLLNKDPAASENQADDSGPQIMYRGQVVRSSKQSAPPESGSEAEVRRELLTLKQLYHEGLISREEAEAARAKLLKGLDR